MINTKCMILCLLLSLSGITGFGDSYIGGHTGNGGDLTKQRKSIVEQQRSEYIKKVKQAFIFGLRNETPANYSSYYFGLIQYVLDRNPIFYKYIFSNEFNEYNKELVKLNYLEKLKLIKYEINKPCYDQYTKSRVAMSAKKFDLNFTVCIDVELLADLKGGPPTFSQIMAGVYHELGHLLLGKGSESEEELEIIASELNNLMYHDDFLYNFLNRDF